MVLDCCSLNSALVDGSNNSVLNGNRLDLMLVDDGLIVSVLDSNLVLADGSIDSALDDNSILVDDSVLDGIKLVSELVNRSNDSGLEDRKFDTIFGDGSIVFLLNDKKLDWVLGNNSIDVKCGNSKLDAILSVGFRMYWLDAIIGTEWVPSISDAILRWLIVIDSPLLTDIEVAALEM